MSVCTAFAYWDSRPTKPTSYVQSYGSGARSHFHFLTASIPDTFLSCCLTDTDININTHTDTQTETHTHTHISLSLSSKVLNSYPLELGDVFYSELPYLSFFFSCGVQTNSLIHFWAELPRQQLSQYSPSDSKHYNPGESFQLLHITSKSIQLSYYTTFRVLD